MRGVDFMYVFDKTVRRQLVMEVRLKIVIVEKEKGRGVKINRTVQRRE